MSTAIARGIGPKWLRSTLAVVAAIYFVALIQRIPDWRWTRPIAFFTQASCLFPTASAYKIDYRLAAWSCLDGKWEPLDVGAYFPLRAEDKESRFHRLAHFYKDNRTVMRALDDFISAHHAETDDGVVGPIGGVRMFQTLEPIPAPGSEVERFSFDPLAPIPSAGIREHWYTPGPERKTRCEAQR